MAASEILDEFLYAIIIYTGIFLFVSSEILEWPALEFDGRNFAAFFIGRCSSSVDRHFRRITRDSAWKFGRNYICDHHFSHRLFHDRYSFLVDFRLWPQAS